MNLPTTVIVGCVATILLGCEANLAGHYREPLAKHPRALQLNSDGSYTFDQMFMADTVAEQGRWMRLEDHVVMLLPEDATKPQWFARVDRGNAIKPLQYSSNARDVLAPSSR